MPAPPPVHASRRSEVGALLAVALVCTGVWGWMVWPLPVHLETMHALTPFGDSHVWVFDRIARMLTLQAPLSPTTNAAGFPGNMDARFLGWGPALLAMPLRLVLSAVGAYNVVFLLTPALAGMATALLVRESTRCSPWVAAAAAVPFGLSPYVLSSLTNGQIEKAQVWVYPLYLWLLHRAIRGPRRWPALLGLPILSLVTVFTCPYLGLVIPLIAVPIGLGWGAWRALRRRSVGPLLAAGLALGLTAAAEAPAGIYYRTSLPGAMAPPSMFRPASTPGGIDGYSRPFTNSPSAEVRTTLQRPTQLYRDNTNHLTYLLLPVWISAIPALLLGLRGRLRALVVVVVGLLVAAGPAWVEGGMYVMRGGAQVRLPMAWLEAHGYPLGQGGQYYRAIAVASLGLCMAVGAGLARLPVRFGVVAGSLFAALAVGDLVQTLRPLTPWPTAGVPGRDVLPTLAEAPGAVLALPFLGPQTVGGFGLLEATLHHQPTSAVARAVRDREAGFFAPWITQVQASAREGQLALALRALGFRHVVLTTVSVSMPQPDLPEFALPALTTSLGQPRKGDGVLVWDLGPPAR